MTPAAPVSLCWSPDRPMTHYKILQGGAPPVRDMVDFMQGDDDFADRLAQGAGQRATGISLFRGRTVPAARPHSHAGTIEIFNPPPVRHRPERVWETLNAVTLDRENLLRNGLFPDTADHAITAQFDILRTRLVHAMQERGWKRIAVTSPTHGCGKSMVAANLALSLARLSWAKTVLVDLELRHPDLARLFGLAPGSLPDVLSGDQPLESHLRRVGGNFALALNSDPVPRAAETLLDPRTTATLKAVVDHLDPTVVVLDLPHALGSDDVISILPHVDAVLLVADATKTTAEDVRACERLFEGRTQLMGVVLNRAEERSLRRYRYGKLFRRSEG